MNEDLVEMLIKAIDRDNSVGSLFSEEDEDYDAWADEVELVPSNPVRVDDDGRYDWGEINWSKIAEVNRAVLTEKSKDLTCLNYLAMSMFQTEGYSGLCAVLKGYATLVEEFGKYLYPQNYDARGNAIHWLNNTLSQAINSADKVPAVGEKEVVRACHEQAQRLGTAITNVFVQDGLIGGEGGSVNGLVDALREREEAIPTETEKTETDSTEPVDEDATKPEDTTVSGVASEALSLAETDFSNRDAYEEAVRLLNETKIHEAFRKLSDRVIAASRSRLLQMICELDLAKLCLKANRFLMASVLLEGLQKENVSFKLGELLPDLSAEIIKWHWDCTQAMKEQKINPDKTLTEKCEQLCKLNINKALEFDRTYSKPEVS
jgi:hypothetical protein